MTAANESLQDAFAAGEGPGLVTLRPTLILTRAGDEKIRRTFWRGLNRWSF